MSSSKVDLSTLAKNPYTEFGSAETLIAKQKELDSLPKEKQKELAESLMLHCPDDELKGFSHAVRALRAHTQDDACFYHVLNGAYATRCRIKGLYDPVNKHPHTLLSGEDFAPDLFNEFAELSTKLLAEKDEDIAMSLALSTPEKDRSTVARNVTIAFPKSTLAETLGAAFTLRKEIDALLSNEPYNFFLSPEFSVNNCARFGKKLFTLVDDKEDEIALKMANTPEVKRKLVLERMESVIRDSSLFEKTRIAFGVPVRLAAPTDGMFQKSPKLVPHVNKEDAPGMSL